MKFKDFYKIARFPLVVLVIHFIITYASNLYFSTHGTDTIMHFLGGISIALAANSYISWAQQHGNIGKLSFWNRSLMIIGCVTLAATLWEIMEFAGDHWVYHYAYYQPSNFDTMKDLIMGLSGGTLTTLLTNFKRKE